MTSATIPGLDSAPTKHAGLLAWVREVAELTQPDRVMFADGSADEYDRLAAQLVEAGTFQKLNDEGMTIVQVTHSEENARYGHRIIRLRDGWISGEEKVTDRIGAEAAAR